MFHCFAQQFQKQRAKNPNSNLTNRNKTTTINERRNKKCDEFGRRKVVHFSRPRARLKCDELSRAAHALTHPGSLPSQRLFVLVPFQPKNNSNSRETLNGNPDLRWIFFGVFGSTFAFKRRRLRNKWIFVVVCFFFGEKPENDEKKIIGLRRLVTVPAVRSYCTDHLLIQIKNQTKKKKFILEKLREI